MRLVWALVVALSEEPTPGLGVPGFAVALPSEQDCRAAMDRQFDALRQYYPAMSGRCVQTAILWESPVPRRRP